MADLPLLEHLAAAGDHVVAGPAGGLVDDHQPVDRRLVSGRWSLSHRQPESCQSASTRAARISASTAPTDPARVNPAAKRCPPPPKRPAMAPTSVSDTARSETRTPSGASLA